MRILVTGGSGYLGSVMVPLLAKNHWVTVVDIWPPDGFSEFVAGDCRDIRMIQPLLHKSDVVIPLAGVVGAPACKKNQYGATTTNQYAIVDMMSRISPNQRVIFPATDSGYPPGVVDETAKMAPQSVYAKTKYEAELAVLGRRGVSLRLASVFGMSHRMRTDLIVNNFVMHAINRKLLDVYEGHFRRSFCHIKDIAKAFEHAIGIAPGPYNVGNALASMTKLELCELIKRSIPSFEWREIYGKHDDDRRDAVVSYDKIEATGWYPTYSISDGIAELIEGLSSAGSPV